MDCEFRDGRLLRRTPDQNGMICDVAEVWLPSGPLGAGELGGCTRLGLRWSPFSE